jgi:hypothetical protein
MLGGGAITDETTDAKNASGDGPLMVFFRILLRVFCDLCDKQPVTTYLSPIMSVLFGSISGWFLLTSSNMALCGFPMTTGSRPAATAMELTMAPVPVVEGESQYFWT